ncbi:MAG: hypothetical protein HQ464_00475 [Planctomycetes bacterium]|nr:hypothetical protein [Planctomycetota bacterium]
MQNVANRWRKIAAPCGVWFVLVAVSVVGRLWQPAWNVTPLAGAAMAAGVAFPNPLVAVSVPLVALTISNLALPGYDLAGAGGIAMAIVIYAAFAWPVLLGGMVRRGRLMTVVGGALACSLGFYLSTNFAHWCLTNDYPRTAAGLLACYVAALPFYRWMPVGDVAWSLALVGGLGWMGAMATSSQRISSHPVEPA